LRDREQEIHAKGASIAAVGLGDMEYARMFRKDTGIDFPLLIDANRAAYRAAGLRSANVLHLLRADNAKARARAHAAGHHQHRTGKNPFQLGGTFVFAPGNRDLFAHVSRSFGDNAAVDGVLRALPG
jgi:peroxiredoxin